MTGRIPLQVKFVRIKTQSKTRSFYQTSADTSDESMVNIDKTVETNYEIFQELITMILSFSAVLLLSNKN